MKNAFGRECQSKVHLGSLVARRAGSVIYLAL